MKHFNLTIFTMAATISLASGTPTLKIILKLSPDSPTGLNGLHHCIPELTTVAAEFKNIRGTASGEYSLQFELKNGGDVLYKVYTVALSKYAYAIPWPIFEEGLRQAMGNGRESIESARGCYIYLTNIVVLKQSLPNSELKNPDINVFTFEKISEDVKYLKVAHTPEFSDIIVPIGKSFDVNGRTRYVYITVDNHDGVY